jgi:serine/threonine protein phosphatase PrpC
MTEGVSPGEVIAPQTKTPGAEQAVSQIPVHTQRLDTPEYQAQVEEALKPHTLTEKAKHSVRRVLSRPARSLKPTVSEPPPSRREQNLAAKTADYSQIYAGRTNLAEDPRLAAERQSSPSLQEAKEKKYDASGATLPSDEHPQENQDKFLVVPEKGLIGVFDGMGGYTGGEKAARITRDQIGQRLLKLHQEQQNLTAYQVEQAFQEGFSLAKAQMGLEVAQDQALKDMGAVALVAQTVNDAGKEKVVYAQAGDARLYVIKKDGTLVLLTQDEGGIPPDVAERIDRATSITDVQGIERYWNMRNLVKNTIDANRANPTIGTYELQHDDLMLLSTSDGVHDNLTPGEIQATLNRMLAQNSNLANISKTLTTEAQQRARSSNFRAKSDDMTAVVMKL